MQQSSSVFDTSPTLIQCFITSAPQKPTEKQQTNGSLGTSKSNEQPNSESSGLFNLSCSSNVKDQSKASQIKSASISQWNDSSRSFCSEEKKCMNSKQNIMKREDYQLSEEEEKQNQN